jgi:hypothetical protein
VFSSDADKAAAAVASGLAAHHQTHAAALREQLAALLAVDPTIEDAAAAKTGAEYIAAAQQTGADVSTAAGALRLLARKSGAAASACSAAAPTFTASELMQIAASMAAVSGAHFGALRAVLHLTYGADAKIASADAVVPASVAGGLTQEL